MLSGPSGVGKTALVRHFLARLHQRHEAVLLTGCCYERESIPFKAFDTLIDSLARYLRHLPQLETERLMPRDVYADADRLPLQRGFEGLVEYQKLRLATHEDLRSRRSRNDGSLHRSTLDAAENLGSRRALLGAPAEQVDA